MKVSQGIPAGSPGALDLNRTWLLSKPNRGDGRRYQQAFRVQLPTAGMAEDVVLGDATDVRLQALAHSFNALDGQSPEAAQVSGTDDHQGLLITLPFARLIERIRFRSSLAPSGKTTQLFRTDGDVIGEEAVASWLNRAAVSMKEGVAKEAKVGNGTGTTAGGAMALNGSQQQVATKGEGLVDMGMAAGLAGGELAVLDSRIVVRLLGATGFVELVVADLTEVTLGTGPENLRVGLRLPALGTEVFFLPVDFAPNAQVNAGEALRTQLAALMRRLKDGLTAPSGAPAAVLPDPLEVELVVESDAPCRFSLSQFGIDYQLVRASFPDGAPKQVLRFPKGELTERQISLQMPAAVKVTSATLALAGDGSAENSAASAGLTPDQLNDTLNAATDSGLRVDGAHGWASPVELAEPMLCKGWDLLLAGLAADSRLHVELVSDANGQPGGEVLGRAEEKLPSPKPRRLVRFRLQKTLLLHAGPYWITLTSQEGACVWYLQAAAGWRVLQLRDGRWEGMKGISDHTGIAVPLPAGGESAAARRYPEITLGGQSLPVLSHDGDWVYDLGTALTAVPLAGSGLVGLELRVLSAAARPLTVYPPRVHFDL